MLGRRTQGQSYESEAHRIRGEALLALGNDRDAQAQIERALDVAGADDLIRIVKNRNGDGNEPENSIFNPKNPSYILKDGCAGR